MSKRNLGKQAAAALKYNPDLNYAPVVVASGLGELAKKIINIASLISNCIMQRVIDMRWICGSSMVHLAELIDGVAL